MLGGEEFLVLMCLYPENGCTKSFLLYLLSPFFPFRSISFCCRYKMLGPIRIWSCFVNLHQLRPEREVLLGGEWNELRSGKWLFSFKFRIFVLFVFFSYKDNRTTNRFVLSTRLMSWAWALFQALRAWELRLSFLLKLVSAKWAKSCAWAVETTSNWSRLAKWVWAKL